MSVVFPLCKRLDYSQVMKLAALANRAGRYNDCFRGVIDNTYYQLSHGISSPSYHSVHMTTPPLFGIICPSSGGMLVNVADVNWCSPAGVLHYFFSCKTVRK